MSPLLSAIIAARNPSRREGPLITVRTVCLEVWPGEIRARHRPNGAEKTTPSAGLHGFRPPPSGIIDRVWIIRGFLIALFAQFATCAWYRRMAFGLLLLTCVTAGLAESNSVPTDALHFSIRIWKKEDGLPQNTVTAITQTRDGYLWLGTYDGLARFDGVRFVVFDSVNSPGLENGRISCLYEDSKGSLWIGHETGNVTRYRAGKFEAKKTSVTISDQAITQIGEDANGRLWLLNQRGSLIYSDDPQAIPPADGVTDPTAYVHESRDAQGAAWIVRNGHISHLENGRLLAEMPNGRPGGPFVYGIGASRKGGMWIASEGQIRRWDKGQWVENRGPMPWDSYKPVSTLVELSDGSLVLGSIDDGFFILSADRPVYHLSRQNGLPNDWVRCIYQDRESNVWISTNNGGLTELTTARFSTLEAPDHWRGQVIKSVTPSHDGGIWIGTEGAGLYHFNFNDGLWKSYAEAEGLSNLYVWSIAESPDGHTRIGTWGGGLFRREGQRFISEPALDSTTPVTSLLLDRQTSDAWIGTRAGVLQLHDGQPRLFGEKAGLISPDIRTIIKDDAGTIWFGMGGGGLGALKDNGTRQFRRADGLSSDFVQCLLADHDGALWIGTSEGGLIRLKDGHFVAITTKHGLPSNVICHIADTDDGYLWISSHNGIVRVAKDELNRCADQGTLLLHQQTFGRSDGLPTLECSGGCQDTGCITPDGKLWFCTTAGLVMVNPKNLSSNSLPPKMLIEEVRFDSELVALPPGVLQVPAGTRRIDLRYTGLSFSAPEKVRFKHRLLGLETRWTDAGLNRETAFPYLPPGHYAFEVVACNNDDVWANEPAVLAFTVLPFFWQTWWFRGLTTSSVVGLAVLSGLHLARRRLKQRLEQAERGHLVENERARIARDIHDDLGVSLTRITLLSQAARAELETPDQVASHLTQIHHTARELTRAMDEIVWAVNPSHDTLESLASYFGKFAQDTLSSAGIRCRLDLPVFLPHWSLSPEIRHNLFLGFKECLHNIMKHAEAVEVRITLTVTENLITLVIADNGCGFTETAPPNHPPGPDRVAGGNGLRNTAERLTGIGGRCEVTSQPGQGTRTTFVLPISAVRREENTGPQSLGN